jgi:hypothetical protein
MRILWKSIRNSAFSCALFIDTLNKMFRIVPNLRFPVSDSDSRSSINKTRLKGIYEWYKIFSASYFTQTTGIEEIVAVL